MRFWVGQALLLLLCIVAPFVAAVFVDTHSEIRRAEQAGAVAVRLAGQNLDSRLKLEAHDTVNKAINMAQKIGERDLVGEANKSTARREAAVAQLEGLLSEGTEVGGFAWYVDETGTIFAENGRKTPDAEPRKISGHPLYRATQEGYALDGFWIEGGRVAMVGAAPVTVRGQASGAVFIGRAIDKTFLASLAQRMSPGSGVTLVADAKPVTTTFDDALASTIVAAVADREEPVAAGALPANKHIEHPTIPLLPFFMPHDADGVAYSSLAVRAPGLDGLSWVVSAPVGDLLRDVPERQWILFGGLLAFFMIALLFGLVNHRLFVVPIARITDHLSEIQFGRGELELAEARVSGPFRRLVKLINMTVQKIPSRGFSAARAPGADMSPISELPPVPMQAPRALDLPARPPTEPRIDRLERVEREETPVVSSSSPVLSPSQSPMLLEHPFGDDNALADAVASMASQASSSPARASLQPRVEDEAAAIAAAIASLEAPMPSAKPRGASNTKKDAAAQSLEAPRSPGGRRNAADIRGVPSESIHGGVPSPFPPSASEMFRGGSNPAFAPSDEMTPVDQIAAQRPPAGSTTRPPRGGGSLDLSAYSGLSGSAGVQENGMGASRVDETGFNPEATVVAPVTDELLRKSASRDETTSTYRVPNLGGADMTMVANVPPNLIAQTIAPDDGLDDPGLDAADHAHFKETYERFLEMRKRCGEPTSDLAFDRFLQKLAKNREGLIKKYNCRTVRFQVYEKDGKAALKATPVRAR